MKKAFRMISLLCAASLLLFALAACGGDKTPPPENDGEDVTTGEDEKKPEDGKTYLIASDTAFAPFEYMDLKTQEYIGLDMDLIQAIAEDQGFAYTMDNMGFKAATLAVQGGQADAMIAGMSITDLRKETFDFSDGYYTNGQIMVVAKDSAIKGLEDLQGKTVAAKASTEGHTYATENAEAYGYTVVTFEDSSTMYTAVMQGNAIACFEDAAVAVFSIGDKGLDLQTVGEEISPADYGFAVKKGENPELIEMFNEGLANIKANGIYEDILAKYGL